MTPDFRPQRSAFSVQLAPLPSLAEGKLARLQGATLALLLAASAIACDEERRPPAELDGDESEAAAELDGSEMELDASEPDELGDELDLAPDADVELDDVEAPEPLPNWSRDLLNLAIDLDLTALRGMARIVVAPDTADSLSLSVGDLVIDWVELDGDRLHYHRHDGQIDIATPPASANFELEISYRFRAHENWDGYSREGQYTFLWPDYCGNLFPCNPNPAEGATYSLSLSGTPENQLAVFSPSVEGDAPAYVVAFAIGSYGYQALGTTTAGTDLGVWFLPGRREIALGGTETLVAAFDWYEQTLGPYAFGDEVASVEVNWIGGGYGGMEHHPYWHVGSESMGDVLTHVHEAAHGWFGDGVRIACWEDFVLSEGLVSYLAARAVEATEGPERAEVVWAVYDGWLDDAIASGDTLARPPGCQLVDLDEHPLWSDIPYMKGAFLMRDLEQLAGREAFDAALASFYRANVGKAATMAELIDSIEASTGIVADDLVHAWLESLGRP